MNLEELLGRELFTLGSFSITVGNLIASVLVMLLLIAVHRLIIARLLPRFFERHQVAFKDRRRIYNLTHVLFLLLAIFLLLLTSGIDYDIYNNENITFTASNLVLALMVWQLARLADQILSKIIIRNYFEKLDREKERLRPVHPTKKSGKKAPGRTVQYIVYTVAILLIVQSFDIDYTLLDFNYQDRTFPIRISNLLIALTILLMARFLTWLFVQLMLYPYYRQKEINVGSQYAINQLVKYLVYIIALLFALQSLGLNITLLLGGAAALLIGVGLGLQQTFNDFFSGILLLFERSVEVGDIVEMEGLVGTVKQIGLRTSLVETRNNIVVIVPNSMLTTDKVINWSHNDDRARFFVGVGVAYGSDTDLIKGLLEQVANDNEKVLKFP
ncbi:MAG: mechanosensitive ion channel, partial [Saprospiraceae bacterium]|nr:mechanosensitive ion channel [Saprospiraceae bacterium]